MDLDQALELCGDDFDVSEKLIVDISKEDLSEGGVALQQFINHVQSVALLKDPTAKQTQLVKDFEAAWAVLNYNCSTVPNPYKSTVAFLCFHHPQVGHWDPRAVLTGISGSEEALIHMSRVLIDEDPTRQVLIYASPPPNSPWSLPLSNPRFLPVDYYKDPPKKAAQSVKTPAYWVPERFDTVICWRVGWFALAKSRSERVYYWPHDIATGGDPQATGLKGIFYLTEWHKGQHQVLFKSFVDVPSVVAGNGIDMGHINNLRPALTDGTPLKSNPYSCLYASNYSRGLKLLLEIWPDVKNNFPEATLTIAYGRETFGTLQKKELDAMIETIEKLKSKGVTEVGKLGHDELIKLMYQTSFWTYPYQGVSETYCITAVKAQATEMIPVVVANHGLKETVSPKAIRVDPGENYEATKTRYRRALIKAMREVTSFNRQEFVEFAQKRTWEAVYAKWKELL
jgi:hypothetical protein